MESKTVQSHLKTVFLLVSISLAFQFIGSFFPEARLWGINQAAFLGLIRLIYPSLFVIGLLIVWSDRRTAWGRDIFEEDNSTGWRRYAYAGVILIAAGAAFYIFSAEAHFLGDGNTIIANPRLAIKTREYGEALIHSLAIRLTGAYAEQACRSVYQSLSLASGLLYVLFLLYYSPRIIRARFASSVFVLLNLISAGTVLFYGYVENYSIATAAIQIMMLSAIAGLSHGRKSIAPIVSFAAALFLHSVSIVYLPALAVYIGLTFTRGAIRKMLWRRPHLVIAAATAAVVVAYVAVRLWGPLFYRLSLLPLFGDRFTTDGYYMLSGSHILDFVNLLFLLTLVPLVIGLFLLLHKLGPGTEGERRVRVFLTVAAVFGIGAAFILEPKLGMARDWDLMSTMLIGVTLSGTYAWARRANRIGRFAAGSALLVVLGVSVLIPWVTLHNSVDRLYAYNMAAMERDPKHCRAGLQNMGAYNDKMGNKVEADRLRRYRRIHFPELQLREEAEYNLSLGRNAEAARIYQMAIAENPSAFMLYRGLGICRLNMDQFAAALDDLVIADALNAYSALTYRLIGRAHEGLGNMSTALRWWRKSIQTDETMADSYLDLAAYYLNNMMPDSADSYLTRLPDSSYPLEVHYWRGLLSYMRSDTAKMIDEFDLYMKQGQDSSVMRNIRRIRTLRQ